MNIYYKYNIWDTGWMTLGLAIFVAAIVYGTFELFVVAIPIILLSYKILMQSRLIQDLEDEVDELMDENAFNAYPEKYDAYMC